MFSDGVLRRIPFQLPQRRLGPVDICDVREAKQPEQHAGNLRLHAVASIVHCILVPAKQREQLPGLTENQCGQVARGVVLFPARSRAKSLVEYQVNLMVTFVLDG